MLTLIERIEQLDLYQERIKQWSEWSIRHLRSYSGAGGMCVLHSGNQKRYGYQSAIKRFITNYIIRTGEFPRGIIYVGKAKIAYVGIDKESEYEIVGNNGFINFDSFRYLESDNKISVDSYISSDSFKFNYQYCVNSVEIIDRVGELECKNKLIGFELSEFEYLNEVKHQLKESPDWYNGIDLIRDDIFDEYILGLAGKNLIQCTNDRNIRLHKLQYKEVRIDFERRSYYYQKH